MPSRSSGDPYGTTDKLDEALLQVMALRLEARGQHPKFKKMLDDYLETMDIDAAKSVLDMGSGTGVVARAIARRPGFSGRVVGVDLSRYLASAAERLAREEGLADRVEFRVGDTRSLELAGGAFDAVVAHTLLSHVKDPLAVVKEAARVVRAGGTVGIFDGDFASLTFGHADPEKGKASDEALVGAVSASPRVMRQMPRLLQAAGLELLASFPYVLTEIGKADFWRSGFESFRMLMPKVGAMTDEEAEAWAEALRQDSERGVFFGSSNYYSYVARRRA
ncbi:MAG TPA: methyltransferase domain-containing protein [Methylomirabilota bacterium]|nr:methyltransferase domain-containing protein [Methylomirabilota bacterium]